MKKRNLFWGIIIGVLFVIATFVVATYFATRGNGDNGGSGVIISTECDNLRQRCIDFCPPNDPMCVEDCNNEAEACRSNQSTHALENKIEELRRERDR
ncbi:unnamed protein product, partial [marine sediment metagenome]